MTPAVNQKLYFEIHIVPDCTLSSALYHVNLDPYHLYQELHYCDTINPKSAIELW